MRSPLITFDLGGVVVRICPTLQCAVERAGLPWREPVHPERPDDIERLLFDWQVGLLEDDAFFEAWAHAFGGRFDSAEARLISEAWLLGEYEGVAQTVEKLHARGFRLGCLSNTCNHHWNHLLQRSEKFPTLSLLTERHASHLFGRMKPDPEIFALYEQAVGVSGDRIVYFDDVQANTHAALERGWRAFPILPDRPPAGQIEQAMVDLGLL